VIEKSDAIVIHDSEETLMLADESRSKMLQKQNEPIMSKKKVNTKPVDYAALNQLSKYFETRFVPQTELSAEQAFWSWYSVQPEEHNLSSSTTIVEVPKELPKLTCENFIGNYIDSQKDYDKSDVDYNDSEEKDHLVLKDQLQVKHVVIDTHVECQEKYAKLKAERYVYMIRYSAYFDNDKQHRKQIADQEVLYDKMSVQLVELDKHTLLVVLEDLRIAGFIWKKKGSSNTSNVDLYAVSLSKLTKTVKQYYRKDLLSCNNSHLGETSIAYVCNDAMNVSCNPRMCELLDDNNFFIFDDESVKISPVSKMPFR
nr:hypothetical protein [Tanacetum cinerariifolium]